MVLYLEVHLYYIMHKVYEGADTSWEGASIFSQSPLHCDDMFKSKSFNIVLNPSIG